VNLEDAPSELIQKHVEQTEKEIASMEKDIEALGLKSTNEFSQAQLAAKKKTHRVMCMRLARLKFELESR
jgi:hypothetical protein